MSSRSSSPCDSELGMNPFEKLTELYRNKNPTEFELPLNMQDFTVMPGNKINLFSLIQQSCYSVKSLSTKQLKERESQA